MTRATSLDQILNDKSEDWTAIYLVGEGLGLEEIKKLANWLESHPNIRELNLANNEIGAEGIIILAQSLKNHTKLSKLNLNNNKVSFRAIKAIKKVVEKQSNLHELCLNNNRVDDEVATILSKGLKNHSSLRVLDLSNNLIKADGAKNLLNSLTNHSNLRVLNLDNNVIEGEGAIVLAETLTNYLKLKTLSLCNNQINGEGAAKLAGSIAKLSQLEILDLDGNQIGNQKNDEGACLLAGSLSNLTKLQKLSLCGNQMGDKVTQELVDKLKLDEKLKNHTELKVLNLAHNQISSDGVTALVQLLENHCQSKSILGLSSAPVLEILNLSNNQIDSNGAKNLAKVLEQYTKLKLLDLGSNNIGDEGAGAIADLLSYYNSGWVSSPALKTLRLHDNRISDEGSERLVTVLQKFKLENLDLSGNKINEPIIQQISDSFKGNKSNLILDRQSPNIEIFPVTYSEGLTEDEINKIKQSIEKEIEAAEGWREGVRKLIRNETCIEASDRQDILDLITDDTILTQKSFTYIHKEMQQCHEELNVDSIKIIKRLIQDQNLISILRGLNYEKSKLFFSQNGIEEIRRLIKKEKLTVDELSKISGDLFKLQRLIDKGISSLSIQEDSKTAEEMKSETFGESESKKAIFILGNTGVGKSTFANLLLGHELKGIKYGDEFKIDTVKSTDIKISHSHSSETQILNRREADDIIVVDCPGFRDTDYIQSIANTYCINELCRTHDQIKFALVVPRKHITTDRSFPNFIQLVKQITNMFGDINKVKGCISLVVTSAYDDSEDKINVNTIIDNIAKSNRTLSVSEKTMLEYLKESLFLFPAPKEEGPIEIKSLLSDIKGGVDHKNDGILLLADDREIKGNFAEAIVNISGNNLNRVIPIIIEAIKNPLQSLDFKNSVFAKNYYLIQPFQPYQQDMTDYSDDKSEEIYSSNDQNNSAITAIDLLSGLKKYLEGKSNSHQAIIHNLTNVIKQFKYFVNQGQELSTGQKNYHKILENYTGFLQQQFSCAKFFSDSFKLKLGGLEILQNKFTESIKANDSNFKKLVTSMVIEENKSKGYYEKALEYLTMYDEPECKINMAKAYIELGNIYLAEEDNQKAIDFYGEAIEAHYTNPEIYRKLGQIFHNMGAYKQAIECYKVINYSLKVMDCFDKWITSSKNDITIPLLMIAKGDYCKSMGFYEDAKRTYHTVFELTDDKKVLTNTSCKIANILKKQHDVIDNFNRMADEENFYHFDKVDTAFIESIAETSVKLLGSGSD